MRWGYSPFTAYTAMINERGGTNPPLPRQLIFAGKRHDHPLRHAKPLRHNNHCYISLKRACFSCPYPTQHTSTLPLPAYLHPSLPAYLHPPLPLHFQHTSTLPSPFTSSIPPPSPPPSLPPTSPTYFCTNSEPMTRMKHASVLFATARAKRVFPVPGGPNRRTPLGGSIPSFTKRSGCNTRGHTKWRTSSGGGGQEDKLK